MNNGIYGFPVGSKATFREVFFDESGTYYPALNCQFIIIDLCGGGGGGVRPSVFSSGGFGGHAGQSIQMVILAEQLGRSNSITIGAGGAGGTSGNVNGTSGGNTSITNNDTGVVICEIFGGKFGGSARPNIVGTNTTSAFSSGSSGTTGETPTGGWGAAGGGGGQNAATGKAGGTPSRMTYNLGTGNMSAETLGGGAAGGVSGGNGSNATKTVRNYGEGAGGGARDPSNSATPGKGGNGIRGSGGGGGSASSVAIADGGNGGNGFVRILEVSSI